MTPRLVAVVCLPSCAESSPLATSALAWVASLDAARVSLLVERRTVLAGLVGIAARERGLVVEEELGPRATWAAPSVVGAAVFGLPDAAIAARARGIKCREWDGMGVER